MMRGLPDEEEVITPSEHVVNEANRLFAILEGAGISYAYDIFEAGGYDVKVDGNFIMQCDPDPGTGEFGNKWFIPSLNSSEELTITLPEDKELLLKALELKRWPSRKYKPLKERIQGKQGILQKSGPKSSEAANFASLGDGYVAWLPQENRGHWFAKPASEREVERVRYVDWRPHGTAPPVTCKGLKMGSMEKDVLCGNNNAFKSHKDLADWFKRDEEITSARNAELDEKIKRCQAALAKMEDVE